ncbi:DUF4386 domain-containing protein [Kibdelosporangium aridum]|uniref:DUF4386 domain-containing protein n=1 Tax=Kibdelosporangium aridum TaxID=2030 RepID=A0A428ZIE3_KIBAR|nr:DUF4386 domain-containing protein [Kibdelosporangium aridum]RSM87876.1 DUF4386 domain-containing protein [Kibdelosporangium aridum]
MSSPRALARTAGLLYLIVAVSTIFAGLVNSRIDSGTIAASATLYRVGFVSELVGAVAFLLTSMTLYLLLKHVNQMAAAAMVIFVAVSVAIQTMNLLNQHTALTIATSQEYAFGPPIAAQLTTLFADMQSNGFLIAQTYFGLWLLPLGYLVMKSDYFPKALGVLLVIGCCGHLVDVFSRFLAPGFGADVSPFAMTFAAIAELSFIAWLLVTSGRRSSRSA